MSIASNPMIFKIRYKIFIAIISTAVISVLALQLLQRHNFQQGLRHYSETHLLERFEPISTTLIERYQQNGNWNFIKGSHTLNLNRLVNRSSTFDLQNQDFASQSLNARRNLGRKLGRDLASPRTLAMLSILDADLNWVAGKRHHRHGATKAMTLNGDTIGYLAIAPTGKLTKKIDRRFAKQQDSDRLWASLAILIGALLSAILISRNLGKPIKHLNEQVQNLSDGKYDIEFTEQRSDELGSLAINVNKLADTLRSNRDQRRQWISDISHELRTPVAVLNAELECIQDGLQALDLDAINNLKSEVERINLLIDDLHQLTQADSGTFTLNLITTDIRKEIEATLHGYADQFEQHQITVSTDLDKLPKVWCDPDRIRQVISNLLQNTLRYTDPSGVLHIAGHAINNEVHLVFEDSTPSVPDESIEYIFDRLYRVDPSRSRTTGASGLGLSICASIIKLHKGNITARKSALGGLAIHIELPINQTGSGEA